ncbi:hypothetical protein PAPYR_4635 [Paratrimastix pyriformis]|uniref:Uncharacterized protein n=1 Tax=Paratrimastix pyriformis TaxID=342808 RepID=A0ABQ8UJD8_9EUKA|nr:hypothetical protein PAPYR_4635 [Paratrimastix pyriformis]
METVLEERFIAPEASGLTQPGQSDSLPQKICIERGDSRKTARPIVDDDDDDEPQPPVKPEDGHPISLPTPKTADNPAQLQKPAPSPSPPMSPGASTPGPSPPARSTSRMVVMDDDDDDAGVTPTPSPRKVKSTHTTNTTPKTPLKRDGPSPATPLKRDGPAPSAGTPGTTPKRTRGRPKGSKDKAPRAAGSGRTRQPSITSFLAKTDPAAPAPSPSPPVAMTPPPAVPPPSPEAALVKRLLPLLTLIPDGLSTAAAALGIDAPPAPPVATTPAAASLPFLGASPATATPGGLLEIQRRLLFEDALETIKKHVPRPSANSTATSPLGLIPLSLPRLPNQDLTWRPSMAVPDLLADLGPHAATPTASTPAGDRGTQHPRDEKTPACASRNLLDFGLV